MESGYLLMKLMLRSQSNLLLAIKRTTQENRGKRTPGIDGRKALTNRKREKLYQEIREHTPWKVKSTKRIHIPKSNGKTRPLGIPALRDRVMQAVVKNALEPSWEARFEAKSYGFRPGRCTHDAIAQSHARLNSSKLHKWVLEGDIKGAFDNISHKFILDTIGQIPGRELIKQWLKAGYVENNVYHLTSSGTPQGGIISPLLANIALDGMENLLSQFHKVKEYHSSPKAKRQRVTKRKLPKYGYCRYADDFLITAETEKDLKEILPIIRKWLKERGLELNEEKTKITPVDTGFNFLGFHIRQYRGKCITKPQKEKVLYFLQKIRDWLNSHKSVPALDVINHLNPVLRGWGNYYRHGASKRTFSYVDSEIYRAIWKWACRRHPNKSKKWIVGKYFQISSEGWKLKYTTLNRLKNKHLEADCVNLPGIGKIKAIFHRPIPTGFKVKLGTIKLEADGWYISLSLEDKSIPQVDEEICPTIENSIGIDVGLSRFLTCDNGSYVEIPRFLRKSATRMSRLQHRKSKLPNGSKDQQKLHKAIAKLHQKIARQRLNFHFSTAYKLFTKADVVFVEDLKLRNLIRRNKPKTEAGEFIPNGQSSSSGMNKSWLDAAHGAFIQILEWVAWKLGKSVVKVDPWGTSQFCSNCLNKVSKTLSDRWHLCACGASCHRDHNSGKIIKLVGLGLASLKTAPRGKSSIAT